MTTQAELLHISSLLSVVVMTSVQSRVDVAVTFVKLHKHEQICSHGTNNLKKIKSLLHFTQRKRVPETVLANSTSLITNQ